MPDPTLPPKTLRYIWMRQSRKVVLTLEKGKDGVGQVRQEAHVRARSCNQLSWGWSLMSFPKAGTPLIQNWPPHSSSRRILVLHRTCHLDAAPHFYLVCSSALGQLSKWPMLEQASPGKGWERAIAVGNKEPTNKNPPKNTNTKHQSKKPQTTTKKPAPRFFWTQGSIIPWWRASLYSVIWELGKRGRAGIIPMGCGEQRPHCRAA